MIFQFSPHCCDASSYITMGERCARTGQCWDMERPIGAVAFASLPFRLGLPPESLIVVNFLLLTLSIYLAGLAIQALASRSQQGASCVWSWAAAALGHLAFMYGDAWVTLMDLPAATIALIGLWLLVLGGSTRKAGLTTVAGLALGLAVIIRPFYLYPAVAAGVGAALAWRWRGRYGAAALGGFAFLLAQPVLLQCSTTYRHLGQWAIADAATKERSIKYHATAPWIGFDSLMPGVPIFYPAEDCFRERIEGGPLMNGAQTTGQQPYTPKYPLYEAYQAGDYAGIACVYLKKQWFYFGSYAWHTYLTDAGERIFSIVILLLNLLMAAGAVYFLRRLDDGPLQAAPIALFAGATWAGATVLQPESRYLMAFDSVLWTFGLAGSAAFFENPAAAPRRRLERAWRVNWPPVFFAAIGVFLFSPLVFHGWAYMGGSDRLFSALPFLTMGARALAHNHLPLWNSFNLSGCRGVGETVNRVLYPPNLLLLKLFPTHLALADTARLLVETLAMLWLGYALFLKVWEDRLLAVFSSVVYSLSLSTVMFLNFPFAAPYCPLLMLYLLWDWPRRPTALIVAGLAAALSLQLLGGSPQFGAYFALFVFSVSMARVCCAGRPADRRPGRLLFIWAASGALALMLCAPDLLPFLQAFSGSNRTALAYPTVAATLQQPWFGVFRLIFPYFMGDFWQFPGVSGYANVNDTEFFPAYAGVVALVFCLLALSRLKRRQVWPWALAIGVLALASVRTPFAVVPYLLFLKAPLLHGRLAVLIPFCMAFLAPEGMRAFLSASERGQRRAVAAVVLLTLFFFIAGTALFSLRWSLLGWIGPENIGAPADQLLARMREAATVFAMLGLATAGILEAYRRGGFTEERFKLACLILLTCDLLYFAKNHTMKDAFAAEPAWHPDNAVAEYLRGRPDQDRYRFHIAMGTPWPGLPPFSPVQPNLYQPSLNIDYGLRDVNGYASFIDRRYVDLLTEGRPHEDPLRIPLGWFTLAHPRVADLLAVKYYAVADRPDLTRPLSAYADRVFAESGAAVYAKRHPVPRFHLACRAVQAATLPEVLARLHAPRFEAESTAIVEPGSGLDYDGSACSAGGKLEMRAEEPELFAGTARLPKPALLVVAETFDPGWRAWVNGRPAPLRRVNYAFQGIDLPAGQSKIEMRFEPPHYRWALACAGLALAALVLLGLWAAFE